MNEATARGAHWVEDAARRRIILLFGMPRSGTTWLGKIFDSHPDTLYRHEPDSGSQLRLQLLPDVSDAGAMQGEIDRFLDSMADTRSAKVCGKLPLFRKRYHSGLSFAFFRLSVLASKAADRVAFRLPVLPFVDYDNIPGLAVVWKSIESLGRLGVILRLRPLARGVVLLRHPCGYVASVLRGERQGKFVSRTSDSEDWGVFEKLLETPQATRRDLQLDDLRLLTAEQRLAWRWLLFNEKALEDVDGQSSCMVVRYEDLCADPRSVTRRLFTHTGLDWSEQTEAFIAQSTTSDDTGYYSVFRNPARGAGRWRNELSPAQVQQIMEIAGVGAPGRFYPD
jgi:hypothetical protein